MIRLHLRAGILLAMVLSAVVLPGLWVARGGPEKKIEQKIEKKIDFNRDIRPILSNSCYACHGPDSGKRKGDPPLRLDTHDGLFGTRDGGAPVIPGKPDDSLMILHVTSDDPDSHMPPPTSTRPQLTKAQIDLLQQWIAQGAEWKNHWAYISPTTRPAVPAPIAATQLPERNAIDGFVGEALDEHHMTSAHEADKVTLIRRLSFDLTGLPPSAEDVAAFVKDQSADAYDKLVDRYLASPHFGERMAVWWLDLVRYADTVGYHSDVNRQIWPYRDYVINAFNGNKHFDQFTVEQLAGDLLPNATKDQKIASGYNRLLQTTEEGGAQAAEYIVKYETDRVRNVSSVWMGSTMGCCQCHDHKYDPFTQKDFYRMAAFFADIKEPAITKVEPDLALPTDEQSKQLADFETQIAANQKALETPTPQLEGAQVQWEASIKEQRKIEWTALAPNSVMSTAGSVFEKLPDSSILVKRGKAKKDEYVLSFTTMVKGITAIRIEALPDKSLPALGPGRAANGNFVLSSIAVTAAKAGAGEDALPTEPVGLHDATASYAQKDPNANLSAGAVLIADKKAAPGWAIYGRTGQPSDIVFQTNSDLGDGTPMQLLVTLGHSFGELHSLGHFRISVTNAARPVVASANDRPAEVDAILAIEPAKRTPEQQTALAKFYRGISPLLEPARTQLASLTKQKTDLENSFAKTLISIADKPRETRLLARGNWQDNTGEIVTPAVPHFLRQIPTIQPTDRATRLDLAKWLTARDNPLTSRVIVNDLWKMYFGQGICKPLDDLGSQSTPPSHPDLLDWLAIEFMDSGWDMKHMIKLMVTSATYRQSSNTTPQMREVDPYNVWLARQGRFRLDAEFMRDNALAIGGLLVDQQGGPSVFPYQPAGLWEFLNFPKRDYPQSHDANLYRRGLYTHWQRTFLNPHLKNFDASTREECVAERTRSNTPQQALTLLDDPAYVEASRAFAEKVLQCGGADRSARLEWAFERALSRPPRDNEVKVLTGLLDKHLAEYKADPKSAEALVHNGESAVPKGLDVAELAAWTNVTRVILNLHETINRL